MRIQRTGTTNHHCTQDFAWKIEVYTYKVQILQELKPNGRPKHKVFALEMLSRIEDGKDCLKKVMFTDEACFHVSGKVN